MRIILETTRNVEPEEVLADLFKLTPMQSTFSISLLALVKGEPRVLTLKQALRVYLEHRLEIVRRRSEYDLGKARQRAHILEGLLIALDNLDEVIDTIRRSRTTETARNNLRKKFQLSVEQAQAILDMPLRRLSSMERRKIKEEHKEKLNLIKYLEKLLSRPDMMREAVGDELQAIRDKYADVRRTQIVDAEDSKVLTATDLLPDEQVWVLIGERGTLARTTSPEMITIPTKPTEQPFALLEANTQDVLYLLAADGKTVTLPVYQLPQARELGKGTHWADLTGLTRRDHLAAAIIRPSTLADGYLFLTTLGGVVKRVRLDDLPGMTSDMFTVINVADKDALGWARLTTGSDEILLATTNGRLIRFKEEDVRPMGLAAAGVMGIKFTDKAAGVTSMDVAQPNSFIWSITDNGLGKATAIDEYPTQGRYGQGVINVKLPKDASEVVSVLVVTERTELLVKISTGSVRKVRLSKTTIGSRSIKPRSVVKIGQRTRMVGTIRSLARHGATEADEAETAVAEQLALLNTPNQTKTKGKS